MAVEAGAVGVAAVGAGVAMEGVGRAAAVGKGGSAATEATVAACNIHTHRIQGIP